MSAQTTIFENAKRKIQIEQTVRGFLQLLDENELNGEIGGQLISGAQLAKDFGDEISILCEPPVVNFIVSAAGLSI